MKNTYKFLNNSFLVKFFEKKITFDCSNADVLLKLETCLTEFQIKNNKEILEKKIEDLQILIDLCEVYNIPKHIFEIDFGLLKSKHYNYFSGFIFHVNSFHFK